MKSRDVYLFDLYPEEDGLVLWFIDGENDKFYLKKSFEPYIFLLKNKESKGILKIITTAFHEDVKIKETKGEDILEGEVPVYKIKAKSPGTYNRLIRYLKNSGLFEVGKFYNTQISPGQLFMFENDLFPFCKFHIEESFSGKRKWTKTDDIRNIEYDVPYLKKIYIKFDISIENPKYLKQLPSLILKTDDGREIVVENDLDYANEFIGKYNPDMIITEYGDSIILPLLSRKSKGNGKSFISYGKVYHRDRAVYLKGRYHIDERNSFFYKEVGMDGIIEISRISCIFPQQVARAPLGTPLTAMEIRKAFKDGYLIPSKKSLAEDFKTAQQLMKIDKGGLTFRPIKGVFENVGELDFFSMYPSIILNYNLSYETINCNHKECNRRLPYVNFRVCDKKMGIVPQVIKFLLLRRKRLKELKEEDKQKALKWLLVVSFGYLGYKNAIFGRIESHEATTAIGREMLLLAKDISESMGFKFLHGLTDSLWLYKKDAKEEDYLNIRDRINRAINKRFVAILDDGIDFKIELEGIYDWIVFVASKAEDIGVPNRYYGKFKGGKIKLRGIDIRRSDTPDFIKEYQEEVIEILKRANGIKELCRLKIYIENITKKYEGMLIDGEIPVVKMISTKTVSKDINLYQKKTDISETAGTLVKEGIKVNPGERLNIVYVEDYKGMPFEVYIKHPKKIDTPRYLKMLHESKKIFDPILGL